MYIPSSLIDPSKHKAIVYNVLETDNGWQIQALLPSRISPTDRLKLLDWFRSYREELKQSRPSWVTMFRATDRVYLLDVVPVSQPKDVLAKTVQPGEIWQQLNLDYA
ncbi:MAG TPA: hypothetical protein VML01_14640 [Bryobacterales bacterium]|nr:hypothetical protein [Bryobacterales bacterium]